MWGHWYPLFRALDDSAHEFKSQGGSIITCTLLLLALNDPQSHPWLVGLGIKPGSLTAEARYYLMHHQGGHGTGKTQGI